MSDLTLPTNYLPQLPSAAIEEKRLVTLAREIAMDLHPLDHILNTHGFSQEEFEKLKQSTYFGRLLSAEIGAWNGAINTAERVKLKSAAMVEDLLLTIHARLIDPKEDLMKVVKGVELSAKLAGLGQAEVKNNDNGDRITITIDLGADSKLSYAPQAPKVIEHESTFEEAVTEALVIDVPDPV